MTVESEFGTIPESEARTPVLEGVGIIVVHERTGQMWVHEDLKDRPLTGRKKGQKSIPLEMRKDGESPRENILGSLAEIFHDYDRDGNHIMPQLARRLFTVDRDWLSIPYPLMVRENGTIILCDMSVLIYDGPPFDISPVDSSEAHPLGWMDVNSFFETDMRTAAKVTVEALHREGIIRERLKTYHNNPSLRQAVFTPDFSLQKYYDDRERKRDMVPYVITATVLHNAAK